MTIKEAFANRGLLTPEGIKPYYRVTYETGWYGNRTVVFQVEHWKTAKEELTRKWEQYAKKAGLQVDSVLEIHCIMKEMAVGK